MYGKKKSFQRKELYRLNTLTTNACTVHYVQVPSICAFTQLSNKRTSHFSGVLCNQLIIVTGNPNLSCIFVSYTSMGIMSTVHYTRTSKHCTLRTLRMDTMLSQYTAEFISLSKSVKLKEVRRPVKNLYQIY